MNNEYLNFWQSDFQLYPRKCLGIGSRLSRDCLENGSVRLRVDYVSITCRLRLVYVFYR